MDNILAAQKLLYLSQINIEVFITLEYQYIIIFPTTYICLLNFTLLNYSIN